MEVNITTWISYWYSWNSAIHQNPGLSDHYLKSLLEKSAADAIAGLALTAANYGEAILILKCFGDKRQICCRYMDILLSVDVVTSDQNLKVLCHLYDHVESHVHSLKSLELPLTIVTVWVKTGLVRTLINVENRNLNFYQNPDYFRNGNSNPWAIFHASFSLTTHLHNAEKSKTVATYITKKPDLR